MDAPQAHRIARADRGGRGRAPRARVAVLRDAAEAERWARVLEDAGIAARVEIDDAQRALPGQSLVPGVPAIPGPMFVYPLTVAALDRRRAERLLAALDDGASRTPRLGVLVAGAALALTLGGAALVLRLALSGELR